ncbi:type IV pilus twitching motility protein PilT [Anaerotruncus massiliensis (ex Togo et al. 2019)]|uniref:type IV pilus twitching motility protein PilT n=1 Tax=Anaerotruncus TaxID=244127 RepID=UPI000C77FE89|nr:PilT/PilU family type 4a pilus ATPase [Anaerotruncus massiliensis (ex Togo et al. 2019)]
MDILHFLQDAVDRRASDIFIIAGLPVTFKVNGQLLRADGGRLTPADSQALIQGAYALAGREIAIVEGGGDDDFSFALQGVSRFRISAYKQRGSLAAVIRVITFELPNPHDLGIPDGVLSLAEMQKGLVLVTGPAGCGKSTTLACVIDAINNSRSAHVITLEDPIEFLHRHKHSIVSQREVATDTQSYVTALRAALRQSPDVILLGEMRDHETISVAMTAAETGHLVLSTLHTVGAANTIDRVIDVFPPNQQQQVRVQLSMVLRAVVSQQLIPTVDGGLVPAFEILLANDAVRNMIRESKVHQIGGVIYSSSSQGMCDMDSSILRLFSDGVISRENALLYSTNPDALARKLGGTGR